MNEQIINPISFNVVNQDPYTWVEEFRRISDYIPTIDSRYLISNHGRIFDEKKQEFKHFIHDYRDGKNNSYNRIQLVTYLSENNNQYSTKYYPVHRIVMACFRPEQGSIMQKLDVNHKDGIKNNNYVHPRLDEYSNLEWTTHSENAKHAFKTGLNSQTGEMNSCHKITENTALKIIELISQNKYSDREIAEKIGNNATISIVASIRRGQTWDYLPRPYQYIPKRKAKLFSETDMHNFCKYITMHKNDNIMLKDLYKNCLLYYGFEITDSNINAIKVMCEGKTFVKVRSQYDF